jgi:hypothetical protein
VLKSFSQRLFSDDFHPDDFHLRKKYECGDVVLGNLAKFHQEKGKLGYPFPKELDHTSSKEFG